MMFKKMMFVALFAVATAAMASAADYSKIPDPLENAKVGQWVSHKMSTGMEQKQTIVDIQGEGDERVITMKMEMSQGEMKLPAQEMKISVKEVKANEAAAREQATDVKISETTIDVGGKTYNVVLVENNVDGNVSKLYLSKDVPVTGIVKMELDNPMMPINLEITGQGE